MPVKVKKLVRARMHKTGESHQTALRHIRAQKPATAGTQHVPHLADQFPERWRNSFEKVAKLASDMGVAGPNRDDRGCWSVSFDCLSVSAQDVLGLLPGVYDQITYREEELIDSTGEGVDIETASGVWVCDIERAVFSYYDHWQAGLGGSVTLYPDEESYRIACDQASQEEPDEI